MVVVQAWSKMFAGKASDYEQLLMTQVLAVTEVSCQTLWQCLQGCTDICKH